MQCNGIVRACTLSIRLIKREGGGGGGAVRENLYTYHIRKSGKEFAG